MAADNRDDEPVYRKSQVVSIINTVINRLSLPYPDVDMKLMDEIHSVKVIIETLRHELHTLAPSDISDSHIPDATDELDAVVKMTEEATEKIMSSCEAVQSDIGNLPSAQGEAITAHMMAIFEACTFQDITGQRISKVVNALKNIDAKIRVLSSILESHLFYNDMPRINKGAPDNEMDHTSKSLMNGPQLPGRGMSQSDIDEILKSMGGE